MVKVLDDSNVHQFWGLSPAIDLLQLRGQTLGHKNYATGLEDLKRLQLADKQPVSQDSEKPLNVLQLAAYDCRHTVYTMCRSTRHLRNQDRPVRLYVYEEEPEGLARHMLLVSILLDEQLTVRDRVERFLEIHGNALLQEKTADYLETCSRAVEEDVMQQLAGSCPVNSLFDLSMLKIADADKMAEALRKHQRKVKYDMSAAWETRCRKFYETRFDFRRNAVDWDYSMRLTAQGTPGVDPALGSIIHAYHFRTWRETGVAYELRECQYVEANRSLLSTAYGRTKEFKDRNGEDRGRSVAAWGFWADILNSPYHSFGTVSEEASFFVPGNKQFKHSSLDVAEHNITALIHELRTGEAYQLPDKSQPSRAPAASGPTSMEDLEQHAELRSAQAAQSPSSSSQPEGGTDANSEQAACIDSVEANMRRQQVAAEVDAQRAKEAALDAAARQRCSHCRIIFLTGDLQKQLTSRAKFAGAFEAITVGSRHIHLLDKERGLAKVAAPGAVLAVENAKYMLQLNQDQVNRFEEMIVSKATDAGWQKAKQPVAGVTAAHTLFHLPARS
ncbi:hypothetical protein WJX72_003474 [[Myrmecia] bisecta]|uniref:Dynein assembly factor 3, axonemal n=1 Tax=[Myrmecia] bisecta TaxID=41462 RepID=A0AAW1PVJ6_9CHLO